MTLQEAKDFIENNVQIDIRYCSDEEVNKTKEAFEIAMAAIDNQIADKELNEMIVWCKNKLSKEKQSSFGLTGKRLEGFEQAMLSVMSYLHSKKKGEKR